MANCIVTDANQITMTGNDTKTIYGRIVREVTNELENTYHYKWEHEDDERTRLKMWTWVGDKKHGFTMSAVNDEKLFRRHVRTNVRRTDQLIASIHGE